MNQEYPLVVIGLDAADYDLLTRWDCQNILLDNHHEIETFAHTKDWPLTAEVWPVIAKGEMPESDDVMRRDTEWNGFIGLVNSIATKVVPTHIRAEIGRYLRLGKEVDGHYFPTNDDHMFGNGVVYNWPGITPAQNWSKANHWFRGHIDGELTDLGYYQSQIALTGQELGWAYAMTKTPVPLVGTRCHMLDYLGHSWCNDTDKLQDAYHVMDELIGHLFKDYPGDVVIISDHGMQVDGDLNPGEHSWRPVLGTTIEGDLPNKMDEIRKWVESNTPSARGNVWKQQTVGTDIEHLKDLGYL